MSMPQWFVAQTKPKQEERADANLRSLGIETFLPRTKEPARRRSPRGRIAPFFPSYLFVHCAIEEMHHKIVYTRGVYRLLGTALGPHPVDVEVIDTIRARIGEDGLIAIGQPFAPGDRVCVTLGPLADLNGVFQSYRRPSERAEILLRTVSGCFRAVVDCSALAAC